MKRKLKLPEYEFGSIVQPGTDLTENQIAYARAQQKGANDPWAKGVGMFGNLAMQVGGSMMSQGMSKGQGTSSGGFNWGQLLQQGVGAAGTAGNASMMDSAQGGGYATGGLVGDGEPPTPAQIRANAEAKLKLIRANQAAWQKEVGAKPLTPEQVKMKMAYKDSIQTYSDIRRAAGTGLTPQQLALNDAVYSEEMRKKKTIVNDPEAGTICGPQDNSRKGHCNSSFVGNTAAYNNAKATGGKVYACGGKVKMNTGGKACGCNECKMRMATGGKIPINVEDKELVQEPGQPAMEVQGASHANGGVDMAVDPGTEVYSTDLKGPDGVSYADRKKRRDKEVADAQKKYKSNPTDKVMKKTLERVTANAQKENQADMTKMQFASVMAKMQESFATGGIAGVESYLSQGWSRPHYDTGGIAEDIWPPIVGVDDEELSMPWQAFQASDISQNEIDMDNASIGAEGIDFGDIESLSKKTLRGPKNKSTGEGEEGKYDKLNSLFGGATTGDMIGLAGQAYSAFKPRQNTMANRAGDQPNINPYANYGKEGLATLDKSKQYINQVRDAQLADMDLNRSASINRNQNSARSVNVARALNLASDAGLTNARNQVYQQFMSAMQGITGQEAGMQNQRDQVVMQGEGARDMADRQDRDAFFTNLATNIVGEGEGIQHIGKNVNAIKTNKVTGELLNSQFSDFKGDINSGNISKISSKGTSAEKTFLSSLPKDIQTKILIDKTYEVKGGKVIDKATGKEVKIN